MRGYIYGGVRMLLYTMPLYIYMGGSSCGSACSYARYMRVLIRKLLYVCPHTHATKCALQELKKALAEALVREELATEELEAALTEKAALQVVI